MRLLGALVLLLGLVTPAAALPENTWVLAIGNNHGDPDEIGLLYAEDDARTMIEALHDVGGVPSGRITLMAGEKADAVRRKLVDLKAELFNLRFQHAINQLENPGRIEAVKKDIARVMTVLAEKQ